MTTPPRVVITGRGALSPVGNTWQETWENLKAGISGIAKIVSFDVSNLETHFAGELKRFDPREHFDVKEARRLQRFIQLAVVAARAAVADAALKITEDISERVAVTIGSGIGGAISLPEQGQILLTKGAKRVSPFFIPMTLVDSAAGQVAIDLKVKGMNFATVSACATGTNSIGEAAEIIKRGDADVVLCGGTEACIAPLAIAGFNVMGALSMRNDDPAGACRPFDATRDGFVMSEGAAVVVLEREDHALARGARILGEVSGYGNSADATHLAAPDAGGEGIVRAMRQALKRAGLTPEDIDYVNAHGTGTRLNDPTETVAVKTVFGEHAYNVPISSTKSMIGHMLGASGAIEVLVGLQAILENILPPTINFSTPDPECDLDYVPNTARPNVTNRVLSNSMGLGGHNASIILSRYAY